MGPRRTMRQVDVFAWLTTERQKLAAKLESMRLLRSVRNAREYDDMIDAIDIARQAARLETIDNLLSQLQESR